MDEITIANQTYKIINLQGRPPAMLDKSVAALYEVATMRVNEARKNNKENFPPEFAFQLTKEEFAKVIENFDNLKYSPLLTLVLHMGRV